jgi:antirestriction protein ArdC
VKGKKTKKQFFVEGGRPMSHAYDLITQQIVAQLEAGTVPWRQPWRTPGVPKNLFTQRPYRGLNVWLLLARPYASPYWTTYRQAQAIGGWVRKGEKGTTVMFWKFADERTEAETGAAVQVRRRAPLLRTYTVFNTEQCELPTSLRERLSVAIHRDGESLTCCERVLRQMPHPPRLVHEVPKAFYAPSNDLVNLPPRLLFDTKESYFSTAFHELCHATGHVSRLARPGVVDLAPFASHAYSKEELIAEMGAAYLCGHCGIAPQTLENAAAYIASWLEHLQNDKTLLLQAASQAQRAVDFILGVTTQVPLPTEDERTETAV